MPTYEYECRACGKHVDVFQSMKDAPLKKCPACGKMQLKRLVGAGAGIIFKGSGFYCNDYKKTSAPADGGSKPAAAADKK